MKTILLFRTSFHPQMRSTYDYLYSYARAHDWQVHTVDYMNAAVSRHWQNNAAPVPDIEGILSFWNPDGCIVECGGIPHEPWTHHFKNVPVVHLDRPQPENDPGAVCVSDNPGEVASVAAKELLSLNLNEYAFVAFNNPLPWSEERGKWFKRYVHQHGKRCHMFRMPEANSSGESFETVAEFLRSLPKPCGLFAANDEVAGSVVTTCDRIGIQIPNDVAVVGVDNDVETCENLPVSLTSIEIDIDSAIGKAVDILGEMLSSRGGRPRGAKIAVKRIVRRASTNRLANLDRRIAAAMEYIRVNACRKIRCEDVVKAMGCSERFASILFRKFTNRTILDSIHLCRIKGAKEHLLANARSIESIANLCGYDSPSDFSRVFKRYTGLTPRDWQRREK